MPSRQSTRCCCLRSSPPGSLDSQFEGKRARDCVLFAQFKDWQIRSDCGRAQVPAASVRRSSARQTHRRGETAGTARAKRRRVARLRALERFDCLSRELLVHDGQSRHVVVDDQLRVHALEGAADHRSCFPVLPSIHGASRSRHVLPFIGGRFRRRATSCPQCSARVAGCADDRRRSKNYPYMKPGLERMPWGRLRQV